MSQLKEPKGPNHVAARPRDEHGRPKPGVHYLKPQPRPYDRKRDAAGRVKPGHFVKQHDENVSIHESEPEVKSSVDETPVATVDATVPSTDA